MPTQLRCGFRVFCQDKHSADEFLSSMPKDCECAVRERFKQSGQFVASVVLSEAVSAGRLRASLEKISPLPEFDFFISVSTPDESFVVDLPKYVSDLYQNIGGPIRFSATYSG